MTPDLINGLIETVGAMFICLSIRRLLEDKAVMGLSLLQVLFFQAWGVWNVFYYPYLDQWFSFYGGLLVVAANTTWMVLALHYRLSAYLKPVDNGGPKTWA